MVCHFTDLNITHNNGTKSIFYASCKGRTHDSTYTTSELIEKIRGYRNERKSNDHPRQ